jgi:hypothetical protein
VSERRPNAIALSILALLPTLLFLDVLLGFNSFYTRDITYYYYPAKKVLREIVLSGHFPYWNPWFSAGQPLAANPEHEVFYPLTWLILLPRFDLAFHLLILAHVYLALFAMYALLRSLQLSRPAAVLGAISFGLGGLTLSTLNLTPYLFSMAWLPLTCLYARRCLRAPRNEMRARDFALAAFFLGIQLLVGEPTTAMQSGIVIGLYAIYRGVKDGGMAFAGNRVAVVGAISIVALLIAAVQVIPALDHFGDSVRVRGLDPYIVGYWSTPLVRLAEIVYPNILGHARIDGPYLYWGGGLYGNSVRPFFLGIYSGLLVAVLLLAGILARVRGTALILAIGATAFLLAAGRNTPLLGILYRSGIAGWLRYPEKFVLMGVFASVVFAAYVLERLLQGDARVRRAALGVTASVTLLAMAMWIVASTSGYEPLFRRIWSLDASSALDAMLALSRRGWLLAAARGLLLFLLIRNLESVRRGVWLVLIGVFVVLDLSAMMPDLAPRIPSSFHRHPPAAARQFPPIRDDFRIFHQAGWNDRSPASRFYRRPNPDLYWTGRNSLAPMTPATWGLRMAMDVDFDLTQLLPTADFTESAWELSAERPADWGDVVASMSNVWYVGVNRPPREGIALAKGDPHEVQPVQFIERPHHPRYYFASTILTIRDRHDFVRTLARTADTRGIACIGEPAFIPARGVVRSWREWVNGARIDVETAGRAFLIMSVTPHKYWRITIDGRETNAIVTNIGYQGVVVPAGSHIVEMNYRNPLIPAGAAVSIATLLALALIARRSSPRRGDGGGGAVDGRR